MVQKKQECLIVTLLIRLGYLKSDDEDFNYLNIPIYNWSKMKTGIIKTSSQIWQGKQLDV